MLESLMGVTPGKPLSQEGTGDDRAVNLFVALWNAKYPNYPVRCHWNPYEPVSYPDVGISERLFNQGFNDTATFPNGIEDAAGDLVESWNANIDSVTEDEWENIKVKARLLNVPKFQMDM